MKTPRLVILILGLAIAGLAAQSARAAARFGNKWNALVGEWKGEGATGGGGACGFHRDLSEQVVVRTNHATLPNAAKAHDDLMIIYPGATEDKARAIYFDNEGHVIEYDAEWSADGAALIFLSKQGMGPQFRLTYKKAEPKAFMVTFEMAAPGQGSFKPYTSGKITRQGA